MHNMHIAKNVHNSLDMTVGAIHPLLLRFTLPLIFGNFFQQLYNTVDSIVVGNYVGKEALAAVGASTTLIRVTLGFFAGVATGASVVVSHHFGAKNIGKMRQAIHSVIMGTFIFGIMLTMLGVFYAPLMLRLMSTPDDVFVEGVIYLRIYFLGLLFLMVYNIGASILRAVGNSSHPFYFLVVTSLLNIVLDIIFVVHFRLGVAGAAYATIISEAVSMLLVLFHLFKTSDVYKLNVKEMHIDKSSMRDVLKIGLPGGLQMAITSFSNVFVQGYINHFGSSCMAGWAVYSKIDQFAMLPMQTMGLSATTFVGQNYGAHQVERAKKGVNAALQISMIITATVTVLLFLLARPISMMFSSDEEVIYYGVYFLRVCSPFFVVCCANQVHAGGLRGFGNSTAPMIIMLSSFVCFRQLYLFVMTRLTPAFWPMSLAYPIGWVMCSLVMAIYYRHSEKKY